MIKLPLEVKRTALEPEDSNGELNSQLKISHKITCISDAISV